MDSKLRNDLRELTTRLGTEMKSKRDQMLATMKRVERLLLGHTVVKQNFACVSKKNPLHEGAGLAANNILA